jgi:stress-induced morphogen
MDGDGSSYTDVSRTSSTDRCMCDMHVILNRGETMQQTLPNRYRIHADNIVPQVQDISGGCGSMYAIAIESAKFQGLSVIKQHKLVNQVLKEEIAGWHGVQLRTKAA